MLNFDSEAFVRQYWQKKPCLLRNAIPDFETTISPEELAGLACEEDVHCRLVMETGAEPPWTLRYGPFQENDFLDLPESNYSLLVSECEKWLPEMSELLDHFRFLPDWRIDDLMISYAPPGGSVGAHVDQYDVFLLQAMGTRRWLYNETPARGDEAIIPGLELAILQDFRPEKDVTLNPGDILYLPPGHAHHGIALDSCMTYSVGFRAPGADAVLESFALESERLGAFERYRDADLELERHHAEITDREIERLRALTQRLLDQSPELWRDAIGKMLSDSPVSMPEPESDQPVYLSDLQASGWIRHPETRLLYHRSAASIEVYCNGAVHELPNDGEILEQLQKLCENHEWPADLMRESIRFEALRELLLELATHHAILPYSD
jgi:50S ribosomal protein L16 3-hydroxylase